MNRMGRVAAALTLVTLSAMSLAAAEDKAVKEAWDRLPAAERHFQRGLKEFQAGRSGEAEKSFAKCLQELPRHAFARYYLANIAYVANDLQGALDAMTRAVADLEFMEALNDYAIKQKNNTYDSYTQMMEEENEATTSCRTHREVASLYGEITDAKNLEEMRRAEQEAARARQKAHYLYFLGNIYFRLQRMPDAAREYEKAIALNPRHADAYNNLAAIHYMAGDAGRALDLLEEAARHGVGDNLNLQLQYLVAEALGRPTEGILQEEFVAGPRGELGVVRFALAFESKSGPGPTLYENAYLLFSRATREAVLIDPGVKDPRIDECVRSRGLKVRAILNTHDHADHTDANAHFARLYGAPVLIKAEDAKYLAAKPSGTFTDGQVLQYDGFSITVLHTPGHTLGSVCFLAGDVLFSGDTLFKNGIGRVTAETPEKMRKLQATMVRAIKEKLLVLPDGTRVCPGHGKTSTIGAERAGNTFLE
jgi:hydroxyacylglutathione hydrolase